MFWSEITDMGLFGKNDEKKEKLIRKLFRLRKEKGHSRLETNFVRVRLHAKQFRKYSKFKNKFNVFYKMDGSEDSGFVLFKDRTLFVYPEERLYFKDEANFKTVIFLIRFDEFACWPVPEEGE